MLAGMQRCLPDSRKRPRTASGRRATRVRALLAAQIHELRTDAGISLRRLGDAAGVDAGYLQQVEAGRREPSISVLAAIAEVLGADLSVRLYPNTGPIVRDHIQARIVEELVRIAHPRWRRLTEVPVYTPARGRIDLVLHDPQPAVVVAMEVHSQVRRLEQQLGWARMKAESLPSADFWRFADSPTVGQLLVVRSTRATRELARRFEATLRAAFPASVADAFATLVGSSPWPGDGLLWADVTGDAVRIPRSPTARRGARRLVAGRLEGERIDAADTARSGSDMEAGTFKESPGDRCPERVVEWFDRIALGDGDRRGEWLVAGPEGRNVRLEHRRGEAVPPMLRGDADRQDLAAGTRLSCGRHDRAHDHVLRDRRGDAHPITLRRCGDHGSWRD
jgi:transcriptional regulator with XRE-family HTH domain